MSEYIYKDFENKEVEIDIEKLVEVMTINNFKVYSMPKSKMNTKINKVVFSDNNKEESNKEEDEYQEFRATVAIFNSNCPTVENGRSKYFIMGEEAFSLIKDKYKSNNVLKLIPLIKK